jgi:hypothetical protein
MNKYGKTTVQEGNDTTSRQKNHAQKFAPFNPDAANRSLFFYHELSA